MKKLKNRNGLIKLILAFIFLVAFYLIATDSRMKVVHYKYQTNKVKKAFKIAHVTDLHSCYYGEGMIDLLYAIDAEKPDFIVLTGDIFEENMPHINSKIFIERIASKYKLYYVTGNHEYYTGNVDEILKILTDNGVKILHGNSESIEINGDEVVISGIDDQCMDWVEGKGSHFIQMRNILSETDSSKLNIFLAHRPYLIEKYAEGKYDLVFCGHSHGGQVRIPYILNGLIEPDQGLFPKYVGGRYEVGDTTMILSRGLARESTRVPRIFNRPELVIVDVENY